MQSKGCGTLQDLRPAEIEQGRSGKSNDELHAGGPGDDQVPHRRQKGWDPRISELLLFGMCRCVRVPPLDDSMT